MNHVLIAIAVLAGPHADEAPRNSGPDFGKASPFGLLVIVLLLVATLFLVWSMNRHLRKLPESFDRRNPEPDQAVDDGTLGMHSVSELPGEPDPPDDRTRIDNDGRPHEPND